MAQSNETSWYGASMAVKTISIKTNAALGTLAEAMLAAVEVNLKEKYFLLRLPEFTRLCLKAKVVTIFQIFYRDFS